MAENKAIESDELQALNEILKNSPYKPVSKISNGSFGEIFKIQDDKR